MNALSFFTNSKAVWVSENFQNIILGKYVYTETNEQGRSVKSSDLQDLQPDIGAQELVFQDVDAFLEQLALLIQNQIHGEEGRLLNDSSANYFFLRGKDGKHYSILVRWEQAQKLWRCGAYLQEELKMPNIRIFYPG
ncbi:MAG: hypothetical protein WC880_04310 [Candidatus Paceibacterota bacterium]